MDYIYNYIYIHIYVYFAISMLLIISTHDRWGSLIDKQNNPLYYCFLDLSLNGFLKYKAYAWVYTYGLHVAMTAVTNLENHSLWHSYSQS